MREANVSSISSSITFCVLIITLRANRGNRSQSPSHPASCVCVHLHYPSLEYMLFVIMCVHTHTTYMLLPVQLSFMGPARSSPTCCECWLLTLMAGWPSSPKNCHPTVASSPRRGDSLHPWGDHGVIKADPVVSWWGLL